MNSMSDVPAAASAARTPHHQYRSVKMQLFPEIMARAHMQDRLYEAESQRRALRLLRAKRLQRKAERASLRARKALAIALMQ